MATQLTSHTLIRCVLACALPLLIFILPALAAPDNTITVCPAGPPQCDYNAIQTAIDAAHSGDTIAVAAGTYTGQLVLKSQLTLSAAGGPADTLITASASPIISASNAVSLTLLGLGIQGQVAFAAPVGIDLVNSSVVLSNVIISKLQGSDGQTGIPTGTAVSGIHISGNSQLTLVNSRIEELTGGHGLDGSGMPGGDVTGLMAVGHGQLSLRNVVVHQLQGGKSGSSPNNRDCFGRGSSAVGVMTDGEIDLDMSDSTMVDLSRGVPCSVIYYSPCVAYAEAGSTIGVQATGGTAALQDNLISDFNAPAEISPEPVYGILTSYTTATYIDHNTITGSSSLTAQLPRSITQPLVFYCEEALSIVGVASENDTSFQLADTTITGMDGYGDKGYGAAVTVDGAAQVTITHNTISGVRGGFNLSSAGIRASELMAVDKAAHVTMTSTPISGARSAPHSSSTGISVSESGDVDIAANRLDHIFGGDGITLGVGFYYGTNGGSASGIELSGIMQASIVNNTVWTVVGGAGGYGQPSGNGGNGIGLLIEDNSPISVWNNVFYQTIPPSSGGGRPGVAIGMSLGSTEGFVVNNVLAHHGVGLSIISPTDVLANANAFWANTKNYDGIAPGLGDLHTNPWFVDAENGDFHLSFLSRLIDAGRTLGAPSVDMDGDSRPYDGNGDGQSRTDIGADEFRPGPLHSVYLPTLWLMSH